jgi:hypothetical protein
MKTIQPTATDPEAAALIAHITAGKPIDPELLRSIRERGDKIRQATFEKHGLLDIAVPAIRELRGPLPE